MRRYTAIFVGLIAILIFTGAIFLPAAAQGEATPTRIPTNTPRGWTGTAESSPTQAPTNTPPLPTESPTPVPTGTPLTPATLSFEGLPPTPTLYYPPNFTPLAQPTAIPTAMPRLLPNAPDGSKYNVINIALLGHDKESTENDKVFRTDTMLIVNINLTTNTVSMLNLPRDLLVWIPDWGMYRLNLAWERGEAYGWTDGGWGLFRQTVLYNFGIDLHYYAMVDFSGFKSIIDRLGGVTIAVDCAIEGPMFTGDYDAENQPIFEENHILDVGVHHLESIEALWYARMRGNSSDFDRGRRQQQVLRAIWAQSKEAGLIAEFPSLWDEINQVVETDLPLEVAIQLIPLALQLQPNQIENHFFRLNFESSPWTTPEGDSVQVPNPAMITLIQNFLTPPTQNQLAALQASVHIYDGSGRGIYLDQVAADRLIWEGVVSEAKGVTDSPYPETTIIDYTGSTTNNNVIGTLLHVLNVDPNKNLFFEPDPNRTVDYEVFIGENYNSCIDRQVQPVDTAGS